MQGKMKSKFNRIMAIYGLINEQSQVNRKELANFCDVSERTISRYIEILRDVLEIPIVYNREQGKYEIYRQDFQEIDSQVLASEEVVLLILALDSAESISGPQIKRLKDKLIANLKPEFKEKYKKMRDELGLDQLKSEKGQIYYINKIYQAILDEKRIDLTYIPAYDDKDVMESDVMPYGVTWKIDKCYLVGKDIEDDRVIIYRLDRIDEINISDREGKIPKDFNLGEFIASCWNMFFGELKEVIIQFDKSISPLVQDKFEMGYEKIKEDEDTFTIKTELRGIPEFKRWIVKVGPDAKVISPESLKEDVKKTAEQILEQYD